MKFEIAEIDNDYRCYVGSEIMEFESKEDADKYCKNASWSGISYIVWCQIGGNK